jgi:hypothetical protein
LKAVRESKPFFLLVWATTRAAAERLRKAFGGFIAEWQGWEFLTAFLTGWAG